MFKRLKFSYFQLTFGQEEAYLHPERTYERLKRFGYDAIEITPPKGRYGLGVRLEHYLTQPISSSWPTMDWPSRVSTSVGARCGIRSPRPIRR